MTVWYQDRSLARASVTALSAASSASKGDGIGTLALRSAWLGPASAAVMLAAGVQHALMPSDGLAVSIGTLMTPEAVPRKTVTLVPSFDEDIGCGPVGVTCPAFFRVKCHVREVRGTVAIR